MALSTTQSIWRSGGGDTTRTAYCGSGVMAAGFYIPDTNSSNTDQVQASSTNTASVILPANAVVLNIEVIGGAGGGETVDMGFEPLNGNAAAPTAYLNGTAADANDTVMLGSATSGTYVGFANPDMSYITGGGTLTGAVEGWITYFVVDPLAGQQNV